jgi:hypothetical protein
MPRMGYLTLQLPFTSVDRVIMVQSEPLLLTFIDIQIRYE